MKPRARQRIVRAIALAVMVAVASSAAGRDAARPLARRFGSATAASAPLVGLELRLSARRRTYELSDGGVRLRRQLALFRRALAEQRAEVAGQRTVPAELKVKLAQRPPSPPEALPVDLALEITNRSASPVEILREGDDRAVITLTLAGPAVELVEPPRLWTLELRGSVPVLLAPGATHRIPIARLAYGHRGDAVRAYWTRPGRYTLRATMETGLRPAPAGLAAGDDGFARVTLTSNEVTVVVGSARGPAGGP